MSKVLKTNLNLRDSTSRARKRSERTRGIQAAEHHDEGSARVVHSYDVAGRSREARCSGCGDRARTTRLGNARAALEHHEVELICGAKRNHLDVLSSGHRGLEHGSNRWEIDIIDSVSQQ